MKHCHFLVTLAAALCCLSACDTTNDDFPMPAEPTVVNGKYVVQFNLSYDKPAPRLSPAYVVPGSALTMAEKPKPEREGYMFGGWYKTPDCKPEDEWLFGAKEASLYPVAYKDSMAVNAPMTLYAKWEAPTHITTAEEFDKIRDDLHGWYVLDNDIDLSAYADWQTIGGYDTDYENCSSEWWSKAFKGILDGQGHAIKGLHITGNQPSMRGLFSALTGATVRDLVIDAPVIDVTGETMYVAPLASVVKEDLSPTCVERVTVKNANIKARFTPHGAIASAVTALVASVWNGTIDNCHATGTLHVETDGTPAGELYVGGLVGEGYTTPLQHSTADLDITARLGGSPDLTAHIGGLAASCTEVYACTAMGSINIENATAAKGLNIGGIVGSHRYGTIKNCASHTDITAHNAPMARIGGVLGEFNATFGIFGAMGGVSVTSAHNSYATGHIGATAIADLGIGGICGVGQPAPLSSWGMNMAYKLKNCAYVASDDAVRVDGTVPTLVRFASVEAMYADALRNILTADDGAGAWEFTSALPEPKADE